MPPYFFTSLFNRLAGSKDYSLLSAFNWESLTRPLYEYAYLSDEVIWLNASSLSEAIYIEHDTNCVRQEIRIACHITPSKYDTEFAGKPFNQKDNIRPLDMGIKAIRDNILYPNTVFKPMSSIETDFPIRDIMRDIMPELNNQALIYVANSKWLQPDYL